MKDIEYRKKKIKTIYLKLCKTLNYHLKKCLKIKKFENRLLFIIIVQIKALINIDKALINIDILIKHK